MLSFVKIRAMQTFWRWIKVNFFLKLINFEEKPSEWQPTPLPPLFSGQMVYDLLSLEARPFCNSNLCDLHLDQIANVVPVRKKPRRRLKPKSGMLNTQRTLGMNLKVARPFTELLQLVCHLFRKCSYSAAFRLQICSAFLSSTADDS